MWLEICITLIFELWGIEGYHVPLLGLRAGRQIPLSPLFNVCIGVYEAEVSRKHKKEKRHIDTFEKQ